MSDALPDGWADRLKAALVETEQKYLFWTSAEGAAADDPDGARAETTRAAGYALLQVLNALRELPSFVDSSGFAPLHDLSAALWHLDQGGRPDLLNPVTKAGDASDSPSRTFVKYHAVAGVYLLAATGMKQTKARQTIAQLFARAGVRGRKGGPLSKTAVDEWCVQVESDPATHRAARDLIAQAIHDGRAGSAEQVVALLKDLLRGPLLRAKIR